MASGLDSTRINISRLSQLVEVNRDRCLGVLAMVMSSMSISGGLEKPGTHTDPVLTRIIAAQGAIEIYPAWMICKAKQRTKGIVSQKKLVEN